MSFTAQLATANSKPGNIVLGFGGSLAPVYLGTASLTGGAAVLAGSATFVAPVYHGSAALIGGAAVIVAAGTVAKPVYTGGASLVGGAAVLHGEALGLANIYKTIAVFSPMFSGG